MKIGNNINVQNVMKSYNKTITNVKKTDKVGLSPDKIEISDAAKEYQLAMQAFNKLPEVREDRVNDIKGQIKDGSYKPSSEDIAKKLLASLSSID
ncbi:MAG: flagellar biosynthesis anti-sigma factor FlgM [Acidaminobacteraceae bacterium]